MIILAVDPSYARIGIAVAQDGKILDCDSFDMDFKSKKIARIFYRAVITTWIYKYSPDKIITERVRLFSKGFIALQSISALSVLLSLIVDIADVPVYSVQTSSWKAKILGRGKATKDDAVAFAKRLGYFGTHDQADAVCIALYGFRKDALLKEVK